MAKVSVIIPTFNEEKTIGEIVQKLKKLYPQYEIIVIDDGSTDNTYNIVSDIDVKVIKHPCNRGNGAAIKTGIRNATGDYLVMMDGDGQHLPEEIPNLLKFLPEYDMVIASRINNSALSRIRNIGNFLFNKFASLLSGEIIEDLTSGFRVMKKDLINNYISLLPNKYSYPTTSLLAFLKDGYMVKFIPINSIKKRTEGKSSIRPIRDGTRFVIIIIKIIMLFAPLRFFIPLSLLFIILGVGYGILYVILITHIPNGAVLCTLTGILIFLVGLLADQISCLRRM